MRNSDTINSGGFWQMWVKLVVNIFCNCNKKYFLRLVMTKEKLPPLGLWRSLVRQTHQVKYLKLVRPGLLRRPTLAHEVSEAGLSVAATASDIHLTGCTQGRSSRQFFKRLNYPLCDELVCSGAGEAAGRLGVVTRWHQQVCEHQQLIVGEALPMLLPVVVVSAPELRQGLLHRHLGGEKKTKRSWQADIYLRPACAGLQHTKWNKASPKWSAHLQVKTKAVVESASSDRAEL